MTSSKSSLVGLENTPLGSQMYNSMNFTSGVFSNKTNSFLLKHKISNNLKEDNPSILTNRPCLH